MVAPSGKANPSSQSAEPEDEEELLEELAPLEEDDELELLEELELGAAPETTILSQ